MGLKSGSGRLEDGFGDDEGVFFAEGEDKDGDAAEDEDGGDEFGLGELDGADGVEGVDADFFNGKAFDADEEKPDGGELAGVGEAVAEEHEDAEDGEAQDGFIDRGGPSWLGEFHAVGACAAGDGDSVEGYVVGVFVGPGPVGEPSEPAGFGGEVGDAPVAVAGELATDTADGVGENEARCKAVDCAEDAKASDVEVSDDENACEDKAAVERKAIEGDEFGERIAPEVAAGFEHGEEFGSCDACDKCNGDDGA